MQALTLISSTITPLKTNHSGEDSLKKMDQFRVNHLPIVKNNFYLGIISDKEINNWESKKDAISEHIPNIVSPHVLENQHLFDIIETVEKNNLSVVPVLDEKQLYLGVITNRKLLYTIAKSAAIQSIGGVIVIRLSENDYSLTEISSIIESESYKILSSHVTSIPNSTQMEITIKTNKSNISSLVKSLKRHGYEIAASYKEDEIDKDFTDRYNHLMRFLNP